MPVQISAYIKLSEVVLANLRSGKHIDPEAVYEDDPLEVVICPIHILIDQIAALQDRSEIIKRFDGDDPIQTTILLKNGDRIDVVESTSDLISAIAQVYRMARSTTGIVIPENN